MAGGELVIITPQTMIPTPPSATGTKLVRVFDRNWMPLTQALVEWDYGTFTLPMIDPMAVELWGNRERGHQISVESTHELAWWIERMEIKDDTMTVLCRPFVDVLRDFTIPDHALVNLWLEAEKRWSIRSAMRALEEAGRRVPHFSEGDALADG